MRCREWIRQAVEPTGLYTIADVEKAIESGAMHFWPARDCAAVTEFVFYPNCKALNIYAGGGIKGKALKELTDVVEPHLVAWAAASDCKKIMAFGIKPEWTPIGHRMGYSHLWTVMAKDIE